MERTQFTHKIGDKDLVLEVSAMAEQANAAVTGKYGDTVVLATAVMSDKNRDTDFMPLRVDYEERFYAAGKILGSRFMRREGRASEDGTLTSRLIDRAIRPLFDSRTRRDMQVVVTTLSLDSDTDAAAFLAMVTASVALHISDIPWNGPIGGVRIAHVGGALVVNPTAAQVEDPSCLFETFVAGPKGKINMLELAGNEAQEGDILKAFDLAQAEIDKLIAFQEEVRSKIGKEKAKVDLFDVPAPLTEAVNTFLASPLKAAVYIADKHEQDAKLSELQTKLTEHLVEKEIEHTGTQVEFLFEAAVAKLIHDEIIGTKNRPDGRNVTDIRALYGEVGLLPRTHGSSYFSRGSTQSLAITTLAAPGSEQLIESMDAMEKRRFMLHYNFPPYSTGEVGPFRSPGRREIGHGALAKKALEPMIPSETDFPYTIRVVSEILSSNGSSSMATVCASTLSLMDAGVPLKKPVAGIAMGLVTDSSGKFEVLTDLQGAEDHWGDMDFKVAGTKDGITAVQLDVKIEGLTPEMVKTTFERARDARFAILDVITSVIAEPRKELSKYAPAVTQFKISSDKIGMVIGGGGKTINGLIAEYKLLTIDIEEDGTVSVAGLDSEKVAAATARIQAMTKDFEIGEIVEGEVVKMMDFGAIVDIGGGRDGMVHVSELKEGFVQHPSDVIKLGDHVRAKIIRVEEGRIGLSIKQLNG